MWQSVLSMTIFLSHTSCSYDPYSTDGQFEDVDHYANEFGGSDGRVQPKSGFRELSDDVDEFNVPSKRRHKEGATECRLNKACAPNKLCLGGKCGDPCLAFCGVNTQCLVLNHRPICAFKPGFVWNRIAGYVPPYRPECRSNSDCPAERPVCDARKCVDFCMGVCGKNTVCQVTDHNPACACGPGFSGDPFKQCTPLDLKKLARERNDTVNRKSHMKKRYMVIKEKKSWAEAAVHCRAEHMNLASIENENEENEAEKVISGGKRKDGDRYLWLGATDFGEKNNFLWISSGNLLKNNNYYDNSGPDGNEHCLGTYSDEKNRWFTFACSTKLFFLCEYFVE